MGNCFWRCPLSEFLSCTVPWVSGKKKIRSLTYTGLAGVVFYYLLLGFKADAYTMTGLILVLVVIMAVYVFSYPKYHAEQIMAAFFGIIYVAVMLSYVYQTRNVQDGAFLVWLIFLCSWGCDTCAYCVGMLIGKHKMSPRVKPEKVGRGSHRRCGRSSHSRSCLCSGHGRPSGRKRKQGADLCADLRSWRTDFHGGRLWRPLPLKETMTLRITES